MHKTILELYIKSLGNQTINHLRFTTKFSDMPWENNVTRSTDICAALTPAGKWAALNCSQSLQYFCLRREKVTPVTFVSELTTSKLYTMTSYKICRL